ncbi:phage tail tube protein [Telmatospirillum sp.]|uniref:phage tail tube protein n=1 Tax=Telmatospirillum sp. TaxID=2079197 RepID=UPI00285051A5|nr:phage tail tube protein [Telmatospirillum sp.]MDR3438951.1 phage tail tube protein [Telmatospirillum sp.]
MGDTTNRLAGTANFTANGVAYALVGEFEYNPSLVTRESAIGMDGVHGYIEKPMAPHISATFRDSGGLTVADFNAMTNVPISVQLANGKLVIGRNMWTVEDQTAKSAEGTIEVRWEGFQGSVTEN